MKQAKTLTAKQLKFVDEYMSNGFNATKACIDAGYNPNSAKQNSYKLSRVPIVMQEIAKRQKIEAEKYDIKKENMVTDLQENIKMVNRLRELALKTKLTTEEAEQFKRMSAVMRVSDVHKSWEQITKLFGWDKQQDDQSAPQQITFQLVQPK